MGEKLPAAPSGSIYKFNITTFESGQRMAKALSESSLVPQDYRNNIAGTMIALEMAQRTTQADGRHAKYARHPRTPGAGRLSSSLRR